MAGKTGLIKSLIVLFSALELLVLAGCATEQELYRAYGLLNQRIDILERRSVNRLAENTQDVLEESGKMLAGLEREIDRVRERTSASIRLVREESGARLAGLERELDRFKEQTAADLRLMQDENSTIFAGLGRDLGRFKEQTAADLRLVQRDIDKDREAILEAATLSDLARSSEALEKKLEIRDRQYSSLLEDKIIQIKREGLDDKALLQAHFENIRQEDIKRIATDLERNRRDIEEGRREYKTAWAAFEKQAADLRVRLDAQDAKAEIAIIKELLGENRAEIRRVMSDIQKNKAQIDKTSAALWELRTEIERNQAELRRNRLGLEGTVLEIERSRHDQSQTRSEVQFAIKEIEQARDDIARVRSELEKSKEELARNTRQLDEGKAVIEKVGEELMGSKIRDADLGADVTELKERMLGLKGHMESYQRQASQLEQANTLRLEAEKRLRQEYGLLSERLEILSKTMENIGKHLEFDPAAPAHQPAGEKPKDQEPAPGTEGFLYERSRELFRQGGYGQAREGFLEVLRKFPEGEYAGDAQFWIGESYFQERNYELAIIEYEKLIAAAVGPRIPQALFKQGQSFLLIGDKTAARIVFQQLLKDYGRSAQARLARIRFGEMN